MGAQGQEGFQAAAPRFHSLSGASEGRSLGQLPRSEQSRVEGEPARKGLPVCRDRATHAPGQVSFIPILRAGPGSWPWASLPGRPPALRLPRDVGRTPSVPAQVQAQVNPRVFGFLWAPHWRLLDAHG